MAEGRDLEEDLFSDENSLYPLSTPGEELEECDSGTWYVFYSLYNCNSIILGNC